VPETKSRCLSSSARRPTRPSPVTALAKCSTRLPYVSVDSYGHGFNAKHANILTASQAWRLRATLVRGIRRSSLTIESCYEPTAPQTPLVASRTLNTLKLCQALLLSLTQFGNALPVALAWLRAFHDRVVDASDKVTNVFRAFEARPSSGVVPRHALTAHQPRGGVTSDCREASSAPRRPRSVDRAPKLCRGTGERSLHTKVGLQDTRNPPPWSAASPMSSWEWRLSDRRITV
jgi:hypothetical protein